MAAMRLERAVIRFDQSALADCRDGLQLAKVRWPLSETKPAHSGGDGAAAHEHNVPVFVHEADKLLRDSGDAGLIESSVLVRQHTRADLDHNGTGTCRDFLADGLNHGFNSCN